MGVKGDCSRRKQGGKWEVLISNIEPFDVGGGGNVYGVWNVRKV